VLDKTLGLFNDHLGHLHVPLRGFVERWKTRRVLRAACGTFAGHAFERQGPNDHTLDFPIN
jgi:hypothetical protein